MTRTYFSLAGCSMMAMALASGAHAQEAAVDDGKPAMSEEVPAIVVTAQRRAQNLQDVPLAVSALDSSQLKNAVVQSVTNLDGKIPNVILELVGAIPFAGTYAIRGLGYSDVQSATEPTVGVEVDGVYQARNVGTVQDFYDIDQVSILRGPQGTLYGRNTIGGVVSLRTKLPGDRLAVEALGTLGSYGRREFRGSIEGPVIEDLLKLRVSMLETHYSGFYHNDYEGGDGRRLGKRNVSGVRGTLVLTPAYNFDATLIVDHSDEKGTGTPLTNVSLPGMVLPAYGYPADPDQPPYHTNVNGFPDGDMRADIRTTGETLQLNWAPGGVKLTSITGYRRTASAVDSDFDGTPISFLNIANHERHRQFSEELRVASDNDGSPLTYVFGLYYLWQRYNNDTAQTGLIFGGEDAGSKLITAQTSKSYAVFGQIDYKVTDRLTLTVGGRYSHDRKRFTIQPLFYPASQTFSKPFNDFSPKAAISYQWTKSLLTYVQYSRGYRSGGFNGRAGNFDVVGPYDAEHVDSFEGGLKSSWFGNRLIANLAIFTADYSDMQQSVQQVLPGTTINQTLTTNAASATLRGVEGELTARPVRGLTVTGTFGYLDAHFNDFTANLGDGLGEIDRSNLPLSFAPKWNASLTGTYELETDLGTFTFQGSGRYQSRIYTSFTPLNVQTDAFIRPKNVSFDASIGFQSLDEHWRVSLYGKNLSDLNLMNNSFSLGSLLALRAYQPPREFGVQLGLSF